MTITLNETQQRGMELYAIANKYKNEDESANVELAVQMLITKTAEMLITEAYKEQQATLSVDDMLQSLS